MLTPVARTIPHLCYIVHVHLSPFFPISWCHTLSTYYQNNDYYCCYCHCYHSPVRVTSSYHLISPTVCGFHSDTSMRFKVFMFVCVTLSLSLVSSPTNVHGVSWHFHITTFLDIIGFYLLYIHYFFSCDPDLLTRLQFTKFRGGFLFNYILAKLS